VAVYLYRLRRKLEQDGVKRIRTVRGAGYRWIGE
jgi:DNA-binding response OmpR family regulator